MNGFALSRRAAALLGGSLFALAFFAAIVGCGIGGEAARASPSPRVSPTPTGGARDVSAACRIHGPLLSGGFIGIDAFARTGTTQDIASGRSVSNKPAYVLYGWGKDRVGSGPARGACLIVDGKVEDRATSLYGVSRPDVAKALDDPALDHSGYLIQVPAGTIAPGTRRIGVAVVSSDGSIAQSSVVRTITFH